MAGNISFHPAPGLGDLIPGFFVVPQNPVTGGRDLSRASYVPGIGDILPGSFAVPQNPLVDFQRGTVRPVGQQSETGYGKAAGAAGAATGMGGCGCDSCKGMGDLTADWNKLTADLTAGNFAVAAQDQIMGFPAWGVAAAAAVVGYFVFLGGPGDSRVTRGRRAYRAAARAYGD